jgi:cell division septation protein DedD
MPTPANATTLDKSDEDNTTALYRAAIGPIHTDYYLPRFARFDSAQRAGLSWNWAAALFTLNWMAYRQLWGAALAYLGAVVAMALLVFGIGRLVFQFTEETEMGLLLLLGPLAFAIPGALGNLLFYSASRKKIAQALEAKSTVPEACEWLEKKASSRRRIFWQGLANAALLGASFASYAALSNLDSLTSHAAKPPEASTPAVANPDSNATAQAQAAEATPAADVTPVVSTETMAAAPPAAAEADGLNPASSAPALAPEAIVVASNTAANTSAPSAPSGAPAAAPGAANTLPAAAPAIVAAAPVSPAVPAEAAAPPPVAVAPAAAAKAARTAPVVKAKKPPATNTTAKGSDTATPAASPKTKTAKPRFLINVGLFAKETNAQKAYKQLTDAGLPATSQELKTSKGKLTRVRVGPFDTQAEADVAASKVRELKLEAVVIER